MTINCTNCNQEFEDNIEAADHILECETPRARIIEWVAYMQAKAGDLTCTKCREELDTETELEQHLTQHFRMNEVKIEEFVPA